MMIVEEEVVVVVFKMLEYDTYYLTEMFHSKL